MPSALASPLLVQKITIAMPGTMKRRNIRADS